MDHRHCFRTAARVHGSQEAPAADWLCGGRRGGEKHIKPGDKNSPYSEATTFHGGSVPVWIADISVVNLKEL
jgi:hypothetical protein